MKQDLKETAFTLCIHMGMRRDGKAFLESDIVENVLGDVDHRRCMDFMMGICHRALLEFMNAHFGECIPEEELTEDELVSFFDQAKEISDD